VTRLTISLAATKPLTFGTQFAETKDLDTGGPVKYVDGTNIPPKLRSHNDGSVRIDSYVT